MALEIECLIHWFDEFRLVLNGGVGPIGLRGGGVFPDAIEPVGVEVLEPALFFILIDEYGEAPLEKDMLA